MTRINKYIASCGISSRRGAEKIIENRQVKINKKVVDDAVKETKIEMIEVPKLRTKVEGPITDIYPPGAIKPTEVPGVKIRDIIPSEKPVEIAPESHQSDQKRQN